MPAKQTLPIHFEDYSAAAFERLVLAFHLRTERYRSIEWYGQVGSDLGRDILVVLDDDSVENGVSMCIQCANHRSLPARKAIRDMDKVQASPTRPARMRFVCGGSVSATTRDKIRAHATKTHLACEVWSGAEFEERLRRGAESLLRRFAEGVDFPDVPSALAGVVAGLDASSDEEVVRLLASLFDRPAFYTPFRNESSIPAFRQALDDTIRGLATGIRQTREGKDLPRIPSRHELRNQSARLAFAEIERGVAGLRARFERLVHSGDIRPCRDHCGNSDCPVYMLSAQAIDHMDEIRSRILDEVRRVYPTFGVRVAW
ncbi:hypothetical protein [Polyangium mundeleinium]|uniref:Restriction endonuclease type IV Mrr domain-containing protein n=1 Tax=Polyangium mundeleinium TaxID=2995306 RepID=A0ABT5F8R0_9BACT|nr:hypothetical protein [Polyangium mundeleinium]MDC0749999.1 hypothetical protein [Polyangium mundeleinium]